LSFTPVAGLIFETKIESFFLESFFLESFFLEQHYCPRTLFSSMSVEWREHVRAVMYPPEWARISALDSFHEFTG